MADALQMLALFSPKSAWQLIELRLPLRSCPSRILIDLHHEGYLKQGRWQSSYSQINHQALVLLICPPIQLPDAAPTHFPPCTPPNQESTPVLFFLWHSCPACHWARMLYTFTLIASIPTPLSDLDFWHSGCLLGGPIWGPSFNLAWYTRFWPWPWEVVLHSLSTGFCFRLPGFESQVYHLMTT